MGWKQWICWVVAGTAVTIPLAAQDNPTLKARELFYTPVAAPMAAKPEEAKPKAVTAAHRTVQKSTRKTATVTQSRPKSVEAKTTEPEPSREPESNTLPGGARLVNASTSSIPLGLRYSILRLGSDGQYEEVDPDSVFRSGDRIRLEVMANDSGYLYVVMRGSSGTWRVLFPSPEIAGGNNRIERGKSYQIPPGKSGRFVFDEQAGEERLSLVLSRAPERDLEKMIYSVRTPEPAAPAEAAPASQSSGKVLLLAENRPSIDDALINRIQSQLTSRDLVFEKVDENTPPPKKGEPKAEKAVYVVNPSTGDNAKLVVNVTLKHE